MSKILKGSVLKEVAAPYLVVPVYNDCTQQSSRIQTASDATATTTTTSKKSRMDATDPTSILKLNELPKWDGCPIWDDQNRSVFLFEKPEIKKFLRRARRTILSSSSPDNPTTTASWRFLCILATLRVVANNLCGDHEEPTIDLTRRQQNENKHQQRDYSVAIEQDCNSDDLPLQHWWSALVSYHYDEYKERKINLFDDDDDDLDYSLLVELWPLIRDYIPWKACQRLHLRIQNRLHILTIPHPLTAWAQKTIFELTNEEIETSWNIYQTMDTLSTKQRRVLLADTTSLPPNRLHVSKLWLDRVANIPERFVGVLIEDPLKIIEGGKSRKSSTASNSSIGISSNIISSALDLPVCHQSCLPNTCLEIHASSTELEKIPRMTSPGHENDIKRWNICCRWIALYDLSGAGSENERRSLSTTPKSSNCDCFQCAYEKKTKIHSLDDSKIIPNEKIKTISIEITSENLAQAQRLAHSYFQQETFGEAMLLYEKCHCYCKLLNIDRTETPSRENIQWLAYTEADLWYTMGAVLLSQRRFACAQQHWKNGSHYQKTHDELSKQLSKQEAYQYFHPENECLVPKFSYTTIQPLKSHSIHNAINSVTQSVFIASDIIDALTCQKLIQWALDYALNNGGWTTSRHYSVPTTDLPVHQVPDLLEWFQKWMPQVLFPLLRDQFGISNGGNEKQRLYVHDAFLVRYEATGSNRFLPLHFDESTHSCVLALNHDFDGGGSYMYNLEQSVAPSTGGMISFLGNRCLHGGTPVSRGVRYILAIFLYLDKELCYRPSQESLTGMESNKNLREEVIDDGNDLSKRLKKDRGSKTGPGGGGFSFSFF